MSMPLTDLASYVKCYDACSSADSGAPVLIVAAGTGDATEVTGQSIDRFSGTSLANSCVLVNSWLAALTNTKTLSFAVELQESSDNSNWDTAEVVQAATVVQTATSTTNFRGVNEHTIDLIGRKRYIRFNLTPDLNASGTDTCTFHTVAILSGYDQVPVA